MTKPKPTADELLRAIVTGTTTKAEPARDATGKTAKTSDASAGTGRKPDLPKKRDSNELLRDLTFNKSY